VITQKLPGDRIRVTVNRAGTRRKLHAVLADRTGGNSRGVVALAAAVAPIVDNRAWLGLDVQPIEPLMVDRFSLPDQRGAIVAYVFPDSPAAKAGLAQGDIIRQVGETRIRDVAALDKLVAARRAGDSLRLTVWRAGVTQVVQVTLASPPPPGSVPQPTLPEAEVEVEAAWLGLDIVPLTDAEREELGLGPSVRGMVVDDVAAGPGVDAGLQAGDVITAVNGQPVPTVDQFKDATEGAPGALLDVLRAGRHFYVAVPPPRAADGFGQAIAGKKPAVQQVVFRLR
jgi:serine protease Do